ncbi:helix-turn-helix domain-containing protein [Larsenimonas suaedae]|uniref:Helix-turn-helix domain-containing protein n=1 Tax=Larsenimonas suaedae TaxID=1851019 RepID=A0ABU1GSH9_9GAMM|nr:helix-turn-helix domain-containing protein [Larsenimonas suaedae]MCM2972414.1 helix-turn-helix domain-containing protein [Larsenimonas suaedae]MDR5894790.1 helix-turn-helix domain-containing protein [Larsenimonas suaedae]
MTSVRPHARPAPRKCVSEAWDANEHARNLTDWSQQYDQLSPGTFHGRLDEIHLPRMQVFREYTSHALDQKCTVWPDSLWLGIPMGKRGCRINGQPSGEHEILCRPGGCDFELLTPDDFGIYGLVVSRSALTGLADENTEGVAHAGTERLWLAPPHRQAVTFVIERLLAMPADRLEIKVHQDILTLALEPILRDARPSAERPPSHARRRKAVERVRAHLNQNAALPVTLDELCAIAHVSPRTLRYSFESVLGISPIQFLRLARLNRVRRYLSTPEAVSVSEGANAWGFYHLSQFARDYKALFGETPSATRERPRRH